MHFRVTRWLGEVLVLAGAVSLAGCRASPEPPGPEVVYVEQGPPPSRVEVIGVAPSRNHVWIAGYWRWERRTWIWNSGEWVVRPRPGAKWVAGRWRRSPRGWYWSPGRWK